jgi:hypothetical protein
VKLGAAVFVAAVLFASQLLLPRLAESRLRSELASTGTVASVHVSAFPALKLLFAKADSVRVRMRRARVGVGDLGARLASTRRAARLSVVIDVLALGPLRLRDVTLRKSGARLAGSASVTRADLSAALPVDLGLHPVASGGGALVMEADVGPVAVRARLSAQDGALRIAPDGLLGGFASVTVFRDPRVRVLGVGAAATGAGFTLTANGALTAK